MKNKGDLYLQMSHEMQRRDRIWNRIINEIKDMPIDWDMKKIDMDTKPCEDAELMSIRAAIDKVVMDCWDEGLKNINKQLKNKTEKN